MPPPVFRQLRLATFGFLTLIVVGLAVMAALTVREQQGLDETADELNRLYTFERTHIVIAQRLITLRQSPAIDAEGQRQVHAQIDELTVMTSSPESARLLQSIIPRLPAIDDGSDNEPLYQLYQAVIVERKHGSRVLARLERHTASQLRFELAAPIAILVVAALVYPITRRRIIQPLEAFGAQLARLSEGEFTPAPVDDRVDPFLLPLHRQFNSLARRLQELEASHRARAASLEAEVRLATRQLLEQQRSLARAERLAATGELAASVAHELRNPLAGIQMTLGNLRNDLPDPELRERVDLVLQEVGRLTRLLNQLLDTARHAPEPPREIRLAELVEDILTLTRCQLSPGIMLEHRIPADLTCRLPQDRLRQALLNLVLNAGAALAERDGTVTVEAAGEGDRLRIRVADDGPGFPPEVLSAGIRPFLSTREHGTGLGLAMVRRFVRDVGGELQLANRQPHGAEVTLLLPADAAA